MRILVISTVLAGACAAPPRAPVQESVELRWRGQVGDVMRLRLTLVHTVTNSTTPEPFEFESAMVMRQQVTEISAAGVGSVDAAYEAIRMKTSIGRDPRSPLRDLALAWGGWVLDYNSTRKDGAGNDPELAAELEPFLEADIHLEIEPSGRIVEVNGFGRPFGHEGETWLGGESLKRMLGLNLFPEENLVAGDRWQYEIAFETPYPETGTMTLRFESVFEGTETRDGTECARIGVRGKMETGPADPASPVAIKLEDSSFSGTMFLSLERGFLQEATLDTSMTFVIAFPMGAKGTQVMEMKERLVRIGEQDPLFE